MAKWQSPDGNKVDFNGTQLGQLLEGLQSVKSLLEVQLKGYEAEMNKAQVELAKYEAQANSRKTGSMRNGK